MQHDHFLPLEGHKLHADRIINVIHMRGESNKGDETSMKYIKPQIANVLSASLAIQGTEKGAIPMLDNNPDAPHFNTVAAYEADE